MELNTIFERQFRDTCLLLHIDKMNKTDKYITTYFNSVGNIVSWKRLQKI